MGFDRVTLDRFWSKVDRRGPDECWPWMRGETGRGYGQFNYLSGQEIAHRFALRCTTGFTGDKALHSCDNRLCCNPAHLRWGTSSQNSIDARNRARMASVKLRLPQVAYIKRLLEAGYKAKEISQCYEVSPRLIYMIRDKKAWADVA